jgi:uncharacterized membrane protein
MSDLKFALFFYCLGFASCASVWFFRAKLKSEVAVVTEKAKEEIAKVKGKIK